MISYIYSLSRSEISHGRRNLNKEFKTHWPGKEREERERQKKDSYYDYGSSSSRRPRGYSPPHRGGSSSEWEIRELREVIELPLLNPELFMRVGIVPPKGCLLYGPPGTGKTLLARAVASQLDANFLKVVSSAIVDKYIGN